VEVVGIDKRVGLGELIIPKAERSDFEQAIFEMLQMEKRKKISETRECRSVDNLLDEARSLNEETFNAVERSPFRTEIILGSGSLPAGGACNVDRDTNTLTLYCDKDLYSLIFAMAGIPNHRADKGGVGEPHGIKHRKSPSAKWGPPEDPESELPWTTFEGDAQLVEAGHGLLLTHGSWGSQTFIPLNVDAEARYDAETLKLLNVLRTSKQPLHIEATVCDWTLSAMKATPRPKIEIFLDAVAGLQAASHRLSRPPSEGSGGGLFRRRSRSSLTVPPGDGEEFIRDLQVQKPESNAFPDFNPLHADGEEGRLSVPPSPSQAGFIRPR
jgi:hypothetical protein